VNISSSFGAPTAPDRDRLCARFIPSSATRYSLKTCFRVISILPFLLFGVFDLHVQRRGADVYFFNDVKQAQAEPYNIRLFVAFQIVVTVPERFLLAL
jgi:hypothetical protein